MVMNKLKENGLVVGFLVSMALFFAKDMMSFRMNNFENLCKQFVQKEIYTGDKTALDIRLQRIDEKLDVLIMAMPKVQVKTK